MIVHTDDSLGLKADGDFDLAVSSLGACVWCLQRCHADRELLSLRNFAVSGCGLVGVGAARRAVVERSELSAGPPARHLLEIT